MQAHNPVNLWPVARSVEETAEEGRNTLRIAHVETDLSGLREKVSSMDHKLDAMLTMIRSIRFWGGAALAMAPSLYHVVTKLWP